MTKYNINECFGIRAHITAPVNRPVAALAGALLSNVNEILNKYKEIEAKTYKTTVNDYDLQMHVIRPVNAVGKTPCIIDIHGGGFVFDAAPHMYELAVRYAIGTGATVVMPRYRLTPKNQYPIQLRECEAAYDWVRENADLISIDSDSVAIMGDSAGGYLAAMTSIYAISKGDRLKFQLLIYPVTDPQMTTESMGKYVDTPVWNSRNTKSMWKMYFGKQEISRESQSLLCMDIPNEMPMTYVETAEFDCLHDEGLLYAKRLESLGVDVSTYETKETMHGFDEVKCEITEKALKSRIDFMRECFYNNIVI